MNIPVVMMFNDNYSIPASVALLSLLTNAIDKHNYDLFILHNDITIEHQNKLNEIVQRFKNAKLQFIQMNNYLINVNTSVYPVELLYKFSVSELFKSLDHIIVTDVDVVFTNDISKEFLRFIGDSQKYYFLGVKQAQNPYHKPFSLDITNNNMHFICGAGYMIYNLKKMREDNIKEKCIDFYKKNSFFCKFPDQDVLNQVCYPHIKLSHPQNMVLTSWYKFDNYLYEYEYTASKSELEEAKNNPVQLHYITSNYWDKPWITPLCPKGEIWWYYLTQTPFYEECFNNLIHYIKIQNAKNSIKNNKLNIAKQLFSVTNEYSNNKKYKVLTILGIKIKFKVTETLARVERE